MDVDPQEQFADNVRHLREERNLTQKQLAALSDLNVTDISRMEKLKREPGLRVLIKVACGLRVPIEQLLKGIQTVDGRGPAPTPRGGGEAINGERAGDVGRRRDGA